MPDNLIDFQEMRFLRLIQRLQEQPAFYLDFAHVADFYQAEWLGELPADACYYCTGLDDGAEQFDIMLSYGRHQLLIQIGNAIQVRYTQDKSGSETG